MGNCLGQTTCTPVIQREAHMSSSLAAPRPAAHVEPTPIMEVAAGFMAAKHLFAASSLGLFEAIEDGARTLAELSGRLGVSQESLRVSADAMAALGLLHRDG